MVVEMMMMMMVMVTVIAMVMGDDYDHNNDDDDAHDLANPVCACCVPIQARGVFACGC